MSSEVTVHDLPAGSAWLSSRSAPASLSLATRALTQRRRGSLEKRAEVCCETYRGSGANSDGRANSSKRHADNLMLIFADSRSVAAVEGAIKIFEQILEFHTLDCICRAEALEDLGNALWQYCYHRAADEARSERCIKLLREALQLRSSDHPLRAHVLHRLATAVRFLGYHCHGNIDALAESITLDRQALKLRHVGHPDRVRSLNNLGVALGISFEYHGDLNMLVEAIAMHRDALRLRPPEHRLRHQSLNNLSGLLLLSFQYQGVPDTLAEAISLSREALQLQSIDRWSALNLLAGSLWVSFSYQGRLDRLDESISLTREALRLLPETHLHRTRVMTGLANVLLARFHAQSDSDALTEAISLLRQVIEMQPLGNPSRDITLAILAGALEANFGEHNRESDLHEALALRRETLQLCSPGHSRRVNRLASLANLYCRPECLSWNEAWTLYHEALRMCSEAHPSRPRLLLGVSRCFLDSNSPFFDLAQGITQLCQGYTGSSSHVTPRLTSAVSALERVEMAYGVISKDLDAPEQLHYMHRILDLHAQIIGLLPDAANLGLDNRDRLEAVTGLDEITRNAAARALQLGRVSQAVEVLEEGRGVFWSQTLRLRSAKFDGVPENDRMELERLLRLLEHGMRKVDGSEQSIAQRDRELESRRRMNQEAETLISKIRDNPGLSRFLLPPAFDALQGALPDGFVVVVNTSKLGHHALVLHRATCFAAVLELERPPQAFNSAVLKAQRPRGSNSIQETEVQDGEVLRAMRLVDAPDGSLEDVLALLWNSIAQPVITKLGLKKLSARCRPRLWWCVTGELGFLPIHAAGDYRGVRATCVADYVVSSYTPTLSTLIKSRDAWTPVSRTELSGVVICEVSSIHNSAGYLPHVLDEVRHVRRCFELAQAQVLNELTEHTTVSQMTGFLQGTPAHIVHLACHGNQDGDPLKSALVLQDGALSIERIMQLNLPHAVLAFLSACQTAKGDRRAPDQAVHLVASMLFSGFRSVVGTMWLMHDADGPKLACRFYEALFEHDHVDLDDIPYALDEAVYTLRRAGVPASRWALFMHMGG